MSANICINKKNLNNFVMCSYHHTLMFNVRNKQTNGKGDRCVRWGGACQLSWLLECRLNNIDWRASCDWISGLTNQKAEKAAKRN